RHRHEPAQPLPHVDDQIVLLHLVADFARNAAETGLDQQGSFAIGQTAFGRRHAADHVRAAALVALVPAAVRAAAVGKPELAVLPFAALGQVVNEFPALVFEVVADLGDLLAGAGHHRAVGAGLTGGGNEYDHHEGETTKTSGGNGMTHGVDLSGD